MAPKIRAFLSPVGWRNVSKTMFANIENAPQTYEELLSPREFAIDDPIDSFLKLWISYVALEGGTAPDGYNEDRELHFGDLHVRGDLNLDNHLLVLGNLHVDGVIWGEEHTALLVAGDLQTRACDLDGPTIVGGKFKADYLHLSRRGFLETVEDVSAQLVVRESYEPSIQSDFKAGHLIDVEEGKILPRLASLLVPAAMRNCKDSFDPVAALELAGQRKPFLKENVASLKKHSAIFDGWSRETAARRA